MEESAAWENTYSLLYLTKTIEAEKRSVRENAFSLNIVGVIAAGAFLSDPERTMFDFETTLETLHFHKGLSVVFIYQPAILLHDKLKADYILVELRLLSPAFPEQGLSKFSED